MFVIWYKCRSPVSTAMGFLTSCQCGTYASMCSGIMLKKKIIQWN
jgi:hypothetical protein